MNEQRKQVPVAAKFLLSCVFCWAGMLVLAPACPAMQVEVDPFIAYVEFHPLGQVDWRSATVSVTGTGEGEPGLAPGPKLRAFAYRAALVNARRNALEVLRDLLLDAESTGRDVLDKDPATTARLEGYLRTVDPGSCAFNDDGSAEVLLEVDIRGRAARFLFPGDPAPVSDAPGSGVSEENHHPRVRVIIDARGLGVRPALRPGVFDQGGKPVFDSKTAKTGRVYFSYVRLTAGEAVTTGFADDSLVVKAERVSGQNPCDMTISDRQAEKLRSALSEHEADGPVLVTIIIY